MKKSRNRGGRLGEAQGERAHGGWGSRNYPGVSREIRLQFDGVQGRRSPQKRLEPGAESARRRIGNRLGKRLGIGRPDRRRPLAFERVIWTRKAKQGQRTGSASGTVETWTRPGIGAFRLCGMKRRVSGHLPGNSPYRSILIRVLSRNYGPFRPRLSAFDRSPALLREPPLAGKQRAEPRPMRQSDQR